MFEKPKMQMLNAWNSKIKRTDHSKSICRYIFSFIFQIKLKFCLLQKKRISQRTSQPKYFERFFINFCPNPTLCTPSGTLSTLSPLLCFERCRNHWILLFMNAWYSNSIPHFVGNCGKKCIANFFTLLWTPDTPNKITNFFLEKYEHSQPCSENTQ
jgi:hypothetical protein